MERVNLTRKLLPPVGVLVLAASLAIVAWASWPVSSQTTTLDCRQCTAFAARPEQRQLVLSLPTRIRWGTLGR